jgi:hypothetical protein
MEQTLKRIGMVLLIGATMAFFCGCDDDKGDDNSTANSSSGTKESKRTTVDALHMTRSASLTIYVKHPNGYGEKMHIYAKNLEWNGTSFTGTVSDTDKKYGGRIEESEISVSGSVSSDMKRLTTINAVKSVDVTTPTPHAGDVKRTVRVEMTLSGLPLTNSNTDDDRPYFTYQKRSPVDKGQYDYKRTVKDSDGVLEAGLGNVTVERVTVYLSTPL